MSRTIRSGQLLTPFGIGQIINFPNEESLMICGLDNWDKIIEKRRADLGITAVDESEFTIRERRLEHLLHVQKFKTPWAYKTSGRTNIKLSIPAVRFPGWHYCSICGYMTQISPDLRDLPACMQIRGGKTCNGRLLSVRFVAVCQAGHIQDVPFREWVHRGTVPAEGHLLRYESGTGSGDLSSVIISCSCGERRSLAGLLNSRKTDGVIVSSALGSLRSRSEEEALTAEGSDGRDSEGQYCRGHRPWLWPEGVSNPERCGLNLQVMIKGGSNIHYSSMISALYLPDSDDDQNPVFEKLKQRITAAGQDPMTFLKRLYEQDVDGMILTAVLSTYPEVTSGQISVQQIKDLLNAANQDASPNAQLPVSEADLRRQEYISILKGRSSEKADFKAIKRSFETYARKQLLEQYFDSVVLIEKLKETRVFKGFSRINAVPEGFNVDLSRELSLQSVTWLPAVQVYGEGIFLHFNDKKIDEWTQRTGTRSFPFISRYHEAQNKRYPQMPERDISPVFVMMHTFAHLLIKRLCFNCGYGSSSLREKIYYSSDPEQRMNGILIYTSSGDAEGSMGGLVRQGSADFLGDMVVEAIEDARWCSGDPVCSDVGSSSGQGPDNVNGAACHNCCILPETCCEEFNVLLDRSTVCGTIAESELGFFSKSQ